MHLLEVVYKKENIEYHQQPTVGDDFDSYLWYEVASKHPGPQSYQGSITVMGDPDGDWTEDRH